MLSQALCGFDLKRPWLSRFAAEGDVIVEVEQIEPRFHVLARFIEFADSLGKKLQRLDIAVRGALIKVSTPLLNLPWGALVRSGLLDPSQHLAVAFAGREFGLQLVCGNSGETKPMIVGGVVVFVFARSAGDLSPALVENAG
ncbi:MAG: hypothetical protein QOI34_974, partial [Verrucomicrobiota bacterium]